MSTEITVMASGSAEPALDFAAAAFGKMTGHRVRIFYNQDIMDFDVLVASRDAVARKFRPAGRVASGGVSVGRMALGVAVRADVTIADIASLDGLMQAILDADGLVITANHTSGLYIESMLEELGLYLRVEARIERYPNGPAAMDRVLAGNGTDLTFLSINEIATYRNKGLIFVGPLPPEVQLVREFVAVAGVSCANKRVAQQFVDFCGGPGKQLFKANGF